MGFSTVDEEMTEDEQPSSQTTDFNLFGLHQSEINNITLTLAQKEFSFNDNSRHSAITENPPANIFQLKNVRQSGSNQKKSPPRNINRNLFEV
jgi:hypothetical protein